MLDSSHLFYIPSAALNCEMPVLVYTPSHYSEQAAREYPAVYVLHGKMEYCETPDASSLARHYPPSFGMAEIADRWGVILVAPVTGNSYHMNHPRHEAARYGDYLAEELIPWTDSHFRTIRSQEKRAVAGYSMGAYGALSLYASRLDSFACCLLRSGSFDPSFRYKTTGEEHWFFSKALGSYAGQETLYQAHNWVEKVRSLEPSKCRFIIECGQEDPLLPVNRALRDSLVSAGIPHIYQECAGGHAWCGQDLSHLLAHMQAYMTTDERAQSTCS